MDADLPPQLRPVLGALAAVMRRREPAIRERVERLRAENPGLGPDELARQLIRTTRRRLASTAAASGAAAIVPGLGTVVAVGTATSQSLYALEQETELVLAIAIVYGRELADSDERLLEALVVVGLAGGAVKLRDNLLIAGGQRVTVAAFRLLPQVWLGRAGRGLLTRVLGRTLSQRAISVIARAAPLAIGVAAGVGFDWAAVSLLGRSAIRYYRQAPTLAMAPAPAIEPLPPEERRDVEAGA
ncbi:MAG TPA: hypothetical protein VLW53_04185 [Candidatus Eisenbacteria bacterium]|nr:hypothetical protein [Candidatus Eisenbacteria bacterium]